MLFDVNKAENAKQFGLQQDNSAMKTTRMSDNYQPYNSPQRNSMLSNNIFADSRLYTPQTDKYSQVQTVKYPNTVSTKYYQESWNNVTNRPQVVINSDHQQTLIADYNASRQDLVQKIVYEASKDYVSKDHTRYAVVSQQANIADQRNLIFNDKNVQRIHTQVQSIHNVDHNYQLHEIHHLERPVHLESMEQVSRWWEARQLVLTRQKAQLENMIQRGLLMGKHETRTIAVKDSFKTGELEAQIQSLQEQLRQRDKTIDELQGVLNDLIEQLNQAENNQENQKFDKELDAIKKKFSKLNNEFHEYQEDAMMKEAELQSLKNRKVVTTTTQVTNRKGSTSNQNRK